jgi:hypothetical protein
MKYVHEVESIILFRKWRVFSLPLPFEDLVEGTNDFFDKQFRSSEKRLEDILKTQPRWLVTWEHHLFKTSSSIFSRTTMNVSGVAEAFCVNFDPLQPEQIRKDKLRKGK